MKAVVFDGRREARPDGVPGAQLRQQINPSPAERRRSITQKKWSLGPTLGLAALGGAAAWFAMRQSRRLDLRGAVAVVTGGGRGLGHAIARELADAGCRLALCGRDAAVIGSAVAALRAR